MKSDRAQKLAADTGALVYWQNAEDSNTLIENDIKTLTAINAALE
jgi:hypothetical protein